jgi:hypothetical protein
MNAPLTPDAIKNLPRHSQTQVALNDQLVMLMDVANRVGLYDAADYLRGKLGR